MSGQFGDKMTEFEKTGLNGELLRAIAELGFEKPMPIQEKVIPLLLEGGRDLVGLAQTGTGKTAAFGLPILHMTDPADRRTQALVLCPTRELCLQIVKDLTNFSKYISGLDVLAVYGGASIDTQIRSLKKGAQIVVATPGRMCDLMRRKKIDISNVSSVVLDEADEMLNMGFQEDMNSILSETPDTKRTLLFSATMPKEVAAIASNYMNDPIEITVGKKNSGNENVLHEYYMVHASDRYNALKRIADMNPDIYGIIFCRTRQETNEVAEKLIADGYSADALHGDLSQAQRDYVMQKFRMRSIQMLVATDVAARGLDVNELTHVINYNLPDDIEVYTHRSGRTGRAGKHGVSISIIHARERFRIERLEKILNRAFERKKVPGGNEICERQLIHFADKICNTDVDSDAINGILPRINEKFESLSREEIIARFVATELSRFLDYYKNTPDLDIPESRDARKPRAERDRNASYTRFFMNIGRADGIQPQNLMSLINRHTRNRAIGIGRTQIMPKVSFFEADSRFTDDIIRAFQKASFGNRKLVVEVADDKGQEPKREKHFQGKKKFRSDENGSRGSYRPRKPQM